MLVIERAFEDAEPTVNPERVRRPRRFQPRAIHDGHREDDQALVTNMGCWRCTGITMKHRARTRSPLVESPLWLRLFERW